MEDHRDVKDVARPAQSTHEEEYGNTSIDKNEATTEAHEAALSVTKKQLVCLKENKANTQESRPDEVSWQSVFSEPVGMSFDSNTFSDSSSETTSESSDLQIADECGLSRNIMEALQLPKASDLGSDEVEANAGKKKDVFEFSDNDESEIPPTIDLKPHNQISKCCNNLCNYQKIGQQMKNKIQELNAHNKCDMKQILLDHLINQEVMGLPTNGFQFYGFFFCKKSFVKILGVSDYIINKALEAFESGQSSFVHGNEIGMRESEASIGFVIWMKLHAQNYGNQAPDEQTTVLPACFTLKDLFEQYQEEAPQPQIKMSTFYRLFKSKFGPYRMNKSLPHIRISSYSTHSMCDQCILLEKYQKTCRKEQDLLFVKSLKQSHKLTYKNADQAIQERRHKALYDPENHIFIQGRSHISIKFTFLNYSILILKV